MFSYVSIVLLNTVYWAKKDLWLKPQTQPRPAAPRTLPLRTVASLMVRPWGFRPCWHPPPGGFSFAVDRCRLGRLTYEKVTGYELSGIKSNILNSSRVPGKNAWKPRIMVLINNLLTVVGYL